MPSNPSSQSALVAANNKYSYFTDHLSPDIRFMIYDILISQEHDIEYCTWAPYICNPGILGPLSETCKKTQMEIERFFNKKALAGLKRIPEFGIFDPEITTFWKRLFPFNVANIEYPFSSEDLQNIPVDQATLPPFGRPSDIRCVPTMGECPGQSERRLQELVKSHRRHWAVLRTGRRPFR